MIYRHSVHESTTFFTKKFGGIYGGIIEIGDFEN